MILESTIWQFVLEYVDKMIFDLYYKYRILVDAQVKKDKQLEIQNIIWTPCNNFNLLNLRPFSTGGFFTFLVALAHGVPDSTVQKCGRCKAPALAQAL